MAKDQTERNAEWRERLVLRSGFFQDNEERRRRGLNGQLTRDPSPEAQAVVRFFRAYPRCWALPDHAGLNDVPDQDKWLSVLLPHYTHTTMEAAAAIVALTEISSLYVQVDHYGESGGGMYNAEMIPDEIAQVRDEVAAMRRLGMWRPE